MSINAPVPRSEDIETLLSAGIAAAKAGQRERAYALLTRVLKQEEKNFLAWLWLSSVVDSPAAREVCLKKALALDPDNDIVRRGLDLVRKQKRDQASPPTELTLSSAAAPESPAAIQAVAAPRRNDSDRRPSQGTGSKLPPILNTVGFRIGVVGLSCLICVIFVLVVSTAGIPMLPSAKEVTPPATQSEPSVYIATITAISTSDTVEAVATEITPLRRSSGAVLSPGQSAESAPGDVVTFTHTITNTGSVTDVFRLEATSPQGWGVELLEIGHQTRALQLPLQLGTAEFVVSTTVPGDIADGSRGRIVVTSSSLTSDAAMSTVTDTITVQITHTYTIPPPIAHRQGPPPVDIGVDFIVLVAHPDVVEHDFPLARAMGADWTRVLLPWLAVEESPGVYNWDNYDPVFDRNVELGFRTLTTVYGAPEWAAEESCGPISDTLALENFLDVVIPRYADATDVWEFMNEPEGRVPHKYGPMIGCWGPHPAEYAQQLQIFYTKVKDLDPGSLVFFAGLAYDGWEHFERSFFDQALQNGAGPFFDGVSFHYFPINPVEFPTLAHKAREIRDTMVRNGVYDKLLWVTETSMWVNTYPGALPGSLEIQRNFIVQEFSRGFGAGVNTILYSGVRQNPRDYLYRWLINLNHEPDNGYSTYQHLAQKIQGLHCVGAEQNVPPDVEAYKFMGEGRTLYISWSNTTTQTVNLPASTDAILTSRDGDASVILPLQEGIVTFEVGTRPVFVEMLAAH
jgi:hypothetical protein